MEKLTQHTAFSTPTSFVRRWVGQLSGWTILVIAIAFLISTPVLFVLSNNVVITKPAVVIAACQVTRCRE